ncbi:MAG: anhydro-N-acetylmuramic acid kinase [Alphaproteobacteria bacterium]|nr:anhydro-N-acetylmuramic acid kinase [Alphaproteobacteria bacterium]
MPSYRVIGLMSGTSLDGIDAALLTTDGESQIVREGFMSVPYDEGLRARIRSCLNLPAGRRGDAAAVERELTEAHAQAIGKLMAAHKSSPVDLIGFHGQTIAHDPARGYTCQLGDGALLAQMTGIRVVNDFRSNDVAAGGQGAPLAPVYHRALSAQLGKPCCFLNIGGVANLTYIGAAGEVIAFDTGAGNALIDDWMLAKTGKKFDSNGETAATGNADEAVLAQMMSHAFFAAPPPKSLDRNDFVSNVWQNLSTEDGAATLTAFTVRGILHAAEHLPQKPLRWIVSGGGRLNAAIMQGLQQGLGVPVNPIEDIGFDGDAIEAEAFAYMAVRSLRGLPISFPGTTAAPREMSGGVLHEPSRARAGTA